MHTSKLIFGLCLAIAGAASAQQQPYQPYAQQPYAQQPYAQPPYGQPPYGQPPYAQPPYAGYGVQQQYPGAYAARPQPHLETRLNLGLVITGSVILGVFWATNIFTGLLAGVDLFGSARASQWDGFRLSSIIPVIGPWIQLGVKPTSFDADNWGTWLIIDGLLQATGLALLIIGIATPVQ